MPLPTVSDLDAGHAIVARGLVKRYGETVALAGIDLDVRAGTVTAVLGPNGAGKTTAVRILTTLTDATEGTTVVAGFDVRADGGEVRRRIGLAAQDATVDPLLTGRENLVMLGELNQLARRLAADRAAELLEQFDLVDAADRQVSGYSGGMRRRLDLAATLVAKPEVLFLDEPTTGLDPRARTELWGVLDTLVDRGTTILLTTQYLDEAERLADDIIVIDRGRIIARGDARTLKREVGGDHINVVVVDATRLEQRRRTGGHPRRRGRASGTGFQSGTSVQARREAEEVTEAPCLSHRGGCVPVGRGVRPSRRPGADPRIHRVAVG